MAANNGGITEDEAALYDRQIRLWGLEAQQRMQQARILVVSVKALTAELCKNIVLAGVGGVTLLDDQIVSEVDLASNFLLDPTTAVGQNRAEAALARLQLLNPRVRIHVDTGKLVDKSSDYFTQFDVVCLIHRPAADLERIDDICRSYNIKFFAGDLFGMIGYLFCDLQQHSYVHEQKRQSETNKDETETVFTPMQETYVSFAASLKKDFSKLSPKKLKKFTTAHFIVQILHLFWSVHGRLPDPLQDEQLLQQTAESYLTARSLPATIIEPKYLQNVVRGARAEISPVAAIVGGIFAQEVLKAISGKNLPVNNYFYYDGFFGLGNVEQVEP